MTLEPAPGLLVRADSDDLDCRIRRFRKGSPDRLVSCSFALPEIVRAVAKLGAGYDDIVALRIRVTLKADRIDPRVNQGQLLRKSYEWTISPRNLRYEKRRL